ncbi:hypothetical protein [Pelagicoccus sp. SDUM812002]|uniref:hypothetical protein n=1 Tax=Pelagicoccus sp. SDUM812002 TaxID=3041266 RepID=UPI00280EE6B6|nr:hypothetical protein [Pelagicoccus sp. SDUM812002]MDQ8187029.1 hypothetical protein [Pelagicoccus sp. SDUM812002]
MSTHAMKGTPALNGTSTVAARQASELKDSLSRQLMGLLDATMRETWLPMGFRVLVVQEFPSMRRMLERNNFRSSLRSHVEHLLEEAEPYGVFSKRSAALRALRGLQADLLITDLAA